MALNVLLVASLVLACLPVSWGYRNGARSESCYDMLVVHEDGFRVPPVVPPMDCGSSCAYQLNMVGRVAGEDNLTVGESNPTTYQCGEVYHLQLVASGAIIRGFMVEARESTSSFEEGSTIWGTWVDDPNNLYHTVDCNATNTSSEGPFPSAATQNEPSSVLTSLDLYWRAPPPPNTTDEYEQLPLEIKFWFVAVQQLLRYFTPVAGPALTRPITSPTTTPAPTSTASTPSTAPPTLPTTPLPPTTSSPTAPPTRPTTSPSTAPPTVLSQVTIIALAAGIAGGIIILSLILLTIVIIVICCLVAKSSKETDSYDKPDEGTKDTFEMGKEKATAAQNV